MAQLSEIIWEYMKAQQRIKMLEHENQRLKEELAELRRQKTERSSIEESIANGWTYG